MAKNFRFRLDPLLRIRQLAEERRKMALAEQLGKLNEQTERARRYDQMLRTEHQNLRSGPLVGELDMRSLAHHRRYVNSLMRGLVQTLCERATTVQAGEKARAELAEAVKQRKALDKLRGRRLAEWRRGADRQEVVALDEMGAPRPGRGANGNDVSD
jgi:flagellar FliJ protein